MATKKVSSRPSSRSKAKKTAKPAVRGSRGILASKGKKVGLSKGKTSSKAGSARSTKGHIGRTAASRFPAASKRGTPTRKVGAGKSQSFKSESVKSRVGVGVRGKTKAQGLKLQGRSKKAIKGKISVRGKVTSKTKTVNRAVANKSSKKGNIRREEKDFETTKGHNARESSRKNVSKETWQNPRNPKQNQSTKTNNDNEDKEYEKEGFGKRSIGRANRSLGQPQGKTEIKRTEINLTLGEKAYDKEYQNRSNLESQAKSKKPQKNRKGKTSGNLSDQGAQGDGEHQHDDTFPAEEYEKLKNFH